jgi:hypothetical protein
MKERTVLAIFVMALLAFGGITMYTVNKMSVTSGKTGTVDTSKNAITGEVSAELFGKDSTLSVAAFDDQAATTTQVAVAGYWWINDVYAGSEALSATARVDYTGAVVGDKVSFIAFNATYPYGTEVKELLIDKLGKLVNLKVSLGSTSQTITFYDEDGNVATSNVTVGSTNYILDKIRIQNTDDKSMFRAALIGFDYPETTNVTEIKVSGLTRFTGEVKRLKSVEDWFIMEKDLNDLATRFDTGAVTIVPNGNAIASETVTVYVVDKAPFVNKDNALAYGYETDATNPIDTGIADLSDTLLLI